MLTAEVPPVLNPPSLFFALDCPTSAASRAAAISISSREGERRGGRARDEAKWAERGVGGSEQREEERWRLQGRVLSASRTSMRRAAPQLGPEPSVSHKSQRVPCQQQGQLGARRCENHLTCKLGGACASCWLREGRSGS